MENQKGFTLIELVIVIIILAILAGIAVPRYLDLRDQATEAAMAAHDGAVKAALAIAIADRAAQNLSPTYPTVAELNTYLMSSNTTAVATGIQYIIAGGGGTHITPTYTQTDCTAPTVSTAGVVRCVGTST